MTNAELSQGELTFNFEKSPSFRVIYVDGAAGSVSPNGRVIHMSVYNERAPIPKSVTNTIVNGVLGPEVLDKRVALPGIYREVEADLIMTVDAAIAIRDWLSTQIDQAIKVSDMMNGNGEGGNQ